MVFKELLTHTSSSSFCLQLPTRRIRTYEPTSTTSQKRERTTRPNQTDLQLTAHGQTNIRGEQQQQQREWSRALIKGVIRNCLAGHHKTNTSLKRRRKKDAGIIWKTNWWSSSGKNLVCEINLIHENQFIFGSAKCSYTSFNRYWVRVINKWFPSEDLVGYIYLQFAR